MDHILLTRWRSHGTHVFVVTERRNVALDLIISEKNINDIETFDDKIVDLRKFHPWHTHHIKFTQQRVNFTWASLDQEWEYCLLTHSTRDRFVNHLDFSIVAFSHHTMFTWCVNSNQFGFVNRIIDILDSSINLVWTFFIVIFTLFFLFLLGLSLLIFTWLIFLLLFISGANTQLNHIILILRRNFILIDLKEFKLGVIP